VSSGPVKRGQKLPATPSYSAFQWLATAEHELVLFAAVWFAIGAIDEFLIDGLWFWLRAKGAAKTVRLTDDGQQNSKA
jgi:adsorption protein B